MLWIGLVFVMLSNGQVVQDSAGFPTEQECMDARADLIKAFNEPKSGVMAYEVVCKRLDKFPKPGGNA